MQYLILGACLITTVLSFVTMMAAFSLKKNQGGNMEDYRRMESLKREILDEMRSNRQETSQSIQSSIRSMSELLVKTQTQTMSIQDTRLAELNRQLTLRQDAFQKTMGETLGRVDKRMSELAGQTEIRLETIRTTMETKLTSMQEDNTKKLDQMRATVDEKLEKTLQDRIGQSFRLVSERLEQVYKGLGEMQSLATGVGDLKKVLSNVKTRGVLGEVQLGAIFEQILSPEQYCRNIATKRGSTCVVEYAVKLPGDGSGEVLLPVDAKFPADAYAQLTDAYDGGDPALIQAAGSMLERRIKLFAKDIRDKYIDPPATTEFGVMFLPFEGLYAEVVRRGLLETLQRDYKVSIAGPTTMAALLNSLQMGFRTLAIQKRSGEVWQVLGAVKTEFEKFGGVLQAAQQKLEQANSELDKLVGVRTRQIQRKLQSVSALPEQESELLIDSDSSAAVRESAIFSADSSGGNDQENQEV
ncbi:MAG TPA: DNA recombination protein RmuC [Clostridia bacterium]|nr:DNA recombination protein RmuC [Clostridia bacterium]